MNQKHIDRLLKVKEQILKEAKLFSMAAWSRQSECGTIRCIGGWALHFAIREGDIAIDDIEGYSCPFSSPLGLGSSETETLFFTEEWPSEMETAYEAAKSNEERAQIAAKRIDQFISDFRQPVAFGCVSEASR